MDISVASDKYPLENLNMTAGKSVYQQDSVSKTTDTEIKSSLQKKGTSTQMFNC